RSAKKRGDDIGAGGVLADCWSRRGTGIGCVVALRVLHGRIETEVSGKNEESLRVKGGARGVGERGGGNMNACESIIVAVTNLPRLLFWMGLPRIRDVWIIRVRLCWTAAIY